MKQSGKILSFKALSIHVLSSSSTTVTDGNLLHPPRLHIPWEQGLSSLSSASASDVSTTVMMLCQQTAPRSRCLQHKGSLLSSIPCQPWTGFSSAPSFRNSVWSSIVLGPAPTKAGWFHDRRKRATGRTAKQNLQHLLKHGTCHLL